MTPPAAPKGFRSLEDFELHHFHSFEKGGHEIRKSFRLPIQYDEHVAQLDPHIVDDLELVKHPAYLLCSDDPTAETYPPALYETVCDNFSNPLAKQLNHAIASHYTTHTAFLAENRQLVATYRPCLKYNTYSPYYQNILDLFAELRKSSFKEKYFYMDWKPLEPLNHSAFFLQCSSLYNLVSPLFSLLVPILILLVPFYIMFRDSVAVNIANYCQLLYKSAASNAVGRLFVTDYATLKVSDMASLFLSAGLYIFSVYQNFLVCRAFHENMKRIHGYFSELKIYLEYTLDAAKNYLHYTADFATRGHTEFNARVSGMADYLDAMHDKVAAVTEYHIGNWGKIGEIGHVLKYFYEMHTNEQFHSTLIYSLGFHGYLDCIEGMQRHVAQGTMCAVEFASPPNAEEEEEGDATVQFRQCFYPCIEAKDVVKNDVDLSKSWIITGPNASGKTTMLKTVFVNILLSQQIGFGFFASGRVLPFHHLHCYLNIPDTSARDSLFEAEARRCGTILKAIEEKGSAARHFCLFDELYSGTNPEEAASSAVAFMRFITKNPRVKCMMTTHFLRVCEPLQATGCIENYCMETSKESEDSQLVYEYRCVKGVSTTKGGLTVLRNLQYPEEILRECESFSPHE